MRWSNEHAGLCERDRRPRATPRRHRECLTTNVDLSAAIADCFENFKNPQRRHSSLSYLTPNEFENLQLTQTQTTFS
jgi:hypothetical protein